MIMEPVSVLQGEFGPKMKALPNDNWREFVRIYCIQGGRNAGRAYGIAFGIIPTSDKERNTCDVGGYRLSHDERVLQAILECTDNTLRSLAPLARHTFEWAMDNPQVPPSDRINAAKAVADRVGLHAKSEHKVTVERIGDDAAQMKRIAHMAQAMGLSLDSFIGKRLAAQAPMIDVTPNEVREPEKDPWADVEY